MWQRGECQFGVCPSSISHDFANFSLCLRVNIINFYVNTVEYEPRSPTSADYAAT
jgi:hypothetical protein